MRIVNLIIGIFALFAVMGCDTSKSLDVFIVDKQEQPDVISFDLQGNLFSSLENISEDERKTLKTLRKFNVLFYKIKTEGDTARYQADTKRLQNILSSGKFQPLMSFTTSGSKVKVYLTGEGDLIDEMIVYGKNREKGWGMLRILGKDMNPSEIMKVLSHANFENVLTGKKKSELNSMFKGLLEDSGKEE